MRRLHLPLTAAPLLLLAACTSSTTVANGGFATPVAVVAAQRAVPGQPDANVVYIANADTTDLRVFQADKGVFVAGPNAISPLAIPLDFRPSRLAADQVGGLGYVVVAGSAPGLDVVDTQTNTVVRPAAPPAGCTSTLSVGCLAAPAVDVATSAGRAFALLAPDATGKSALALLTPTVENKTPVLTLDSTLPLPVSGTGLGAMSDGTRVFVADGAAARVVEVTIATGATRDITAAAPVRDVVVVPAYTATVNHVQQQHPEGEFILALLEDGRMQTLSPAAGGPAPDPIDPTKPIQPFEAISSLTGNDLTTPIQDFVFVPGEGTPPTSSLRVNTESNAPVHTVPLLGFAALGDGAALAMIPDPAAPQVFLPLADTNTAGPTVGTPTFVEPATPVPTAVPTLTVDPASLTEGITRTETFTLTQNGVIPGFQGRPASLADAGGGSFTLTDPLGGFDAPGAAAVGDLVVVRSGCADLLGKSLTVSAVAPTVLTVTAPNTPALPAGCVRITYDLQAEGTASWTVVGSATGYVGRVTPGTRFVVPGRRYTYPSSPGPTTPNGSAVAFTLAQTAAPIAGSTFTFSTASNFAPFEIRGDVGSVTERFTLANSVAAIPKRLFVVVTGNNAMMDASLPDFGTANALKILR